MLYKIKALGVVEMLFWKTERDLTTKTASHDPTIVKSAVILEKYAGITTTPRVSLGVGFVIDVIGR